MKKLFYALTAATVVGTSVVPVGVFANNQINNLNNIQVNEKHYQLNSFRNIVLFINSVFSKDKDKMEEIEEETELSEIMSIKKTEFERQFFDKKEGILKSLKMSPEEEVVLQTFSNTYTNRTSNKQTFPTQEFSKTITNSHSFSVSEKVAAKISFKIPFLANTEITAELSSEKNWSHIETAEEKMVYPSQTIIVNPYSVGKVEYIIRQGTYFNEGVIRVSADLNLNNLLSVPLFYINDDGRWTRTIFSITLEEFVYLLYKNGYEKEISMNNIEYSLISASMNDKGILENIYLNLPITWSSQGGKLDVEFSETPL